MKVTVTFEVLSDGNDEISISKVDGLLEADVKADDPKTAEEVGSGLRALVSQIVKEEVLKMVKPDVNNLKKMKPLNPWIWEDAKRGCMSKKDPNEEVALKRKDVDKIILEITRNRSDIIAQESIMKDLMRIQRGKLLNERSSEHAKGE